MKYLCLLFIILSVFCPFAFATDNYKLIGSNSYETLYFDIDTIRFVKELNTIYGLIAPMIQKKKS